VPFAALCKLKTRTAHKLKNYVYKIVLIKIYGYEVPSKQMGISPSGICIKQLESISEILTDFYIWEIQDLFVYMTDQRLPNTPALFY
jgi:hypothetical protein